MCLCLIFSVVRFDSTDKIHHCRACGEGFCSSCSDFQRPVPEHGWGTEPVRVCKPCYTRTSQGVRGGTGPNIEPSEVQARKVGETVYGTVSSLANVLEFPVSIIKDSARPDYWVPDQEITECAVCNNTIGHTAQSSQVVLYSGISSFVNISMKVLMFLTTSLAGLHLSPPLQTVWPGGV